MAKNTAAALVIEACAATSIFLLIGIILASYGTGGIDMYAKTITILFYIGALIFFSWVIATVDRLEKNKKI